MSLVVGPQVDCMNSWFRILACIVLVSLPCNCARVTRDSRTAQYEYWDPLNGSFHRELGTIRVQYNRSLGRIIEQDLAIDTEWTRTRLLATRLSADSKLEYVVDYDAGPSLDPGFIIYEVAAESLVQVGYEFGLSLSVPGDGYIYIEGHTNQNFNKRRIFAIKEHELVEVRQPFYFVGARSKALVDIELVNSKGGTDRIAVVKAGDPLCVVLNDEEYYLIRTEQGILGWWKPHTLSQYKGEEVQDIFFQGD